MSEYVLYHATYKEHLSSIQRNGLLANPPKKNWDISERGVYLTDCPDTAISFAETAEDNQLPDDVDFEEEIILFKLNAYDLDLLKLKLDPNYQRGEGDPPLCWVYCDDIDFSKLLQIDYWDGEI